MVQRKDLHILLLFPQLTGTENNVKTLHASKEQDSIIIPPDSLY